MSLGRGRFWILCVIESLDTIRPNFKSQPFVDPARIAISGCSYGGIQTRLIGERDLNVKALVPFAPAAMSWEQNQLLQDRLIRAVDLPSLRQQPSGWALEILFLGN